MPETFSRQWLQRNPLVSDPGMHQGTCVTHVPWYMSGSLTRAGGENVPGIILCLMTSIPGWLIRAYCKIQRPTKYLNECQTFVVRLDKGLDILILFQISLKIKFTANLIVYIFATFYFYLCLDSIRQIVWISWHSLEASKDPSCDIKCIIRYQLVLLCQGLYLLSG